jgi:ribose transport system substrate-binding protein
LTSIKRFVVTRLRLGASLALAALLSAVAVGSMSASNFAAASESAQTGLNAAKEVLAQATHFPSKITVTAPLKKAPPKGKTIVYMLNQEPQSPIIGNAVAASAQALGWTYKAVNFDVANPGTLVTGMLNALQYNPVAVIIPGNPEAEWQSVLPEYKKAGVGIIADFTGPTDPSPVIIANLVDTPSLVGEGKNIAAWQAVNSKGHGNSLLVAIPSFEVLNVPDIAYVSALKKYCPDCRVTTQTATVAEATTGNQLITSVVSAIRENTSIKYVVCYDSAFLEGLNTALSAAGLSDVQLIGSGPAIDQEEQLKTGQVGALGTDELAYSGAQSVDVAIRHLEGMSYPSDDYGVWEGLITKNTPGFVPAPSHSYPANYQKQFDALWKKS